MATKRLVPSAIHASDPGTWTVTLGDIDNTIAAADGNVAVPASKNDQLWLEFPDGEFVDGDTITDVDVEVRARTTGVGNDGLDVFVYIDGTSQTGQSWTLPGTMSNNIFSDPDWDSDWTAAQMNSLYIRLIGAQSGKPETVGHEVDEVELIVVYTPAVTGSDELDFERGANRGIARGVSRGT